jgi:hypothetical protein
MAKVTFGPGAHRARSRMVKSAAPSGRSPEELVRELKREADRARDEGYRERSLTIHGLVCAKCGRTFEAANRHLLTVHHRDGNHHNNPPDGSNWENLCIYCHEDAHSRELLGDYLLETSGGSEAELVYRDEGQPAAGSFGLLGDRLKQALHKTKK